MAPRTVEPGALSTPGTWAVIDAALRSGAPVVAPDPGGAMLVASRDHAARFDRPGEGPALLVSTARALIEAAGLVHARHRLLAKKLTPGPIVFRTPLGAFRVPASLAARRAIEKFAAPLVGWELALHDEPAHAREEVEAALNARGIGGDEAVIVSADVEASRRKATRVELLDDGAIVVEPGGVYEERYISGKLVRTILFVCTGNTCRSPMAEAVARHWLAQRGPEVETRVRSAGVAAFGGAPTSEEAVVSLRAMGVDAPPGRSTALTRELIGEADVIYTMTPAHAASVLALDPSAAGRVFMLDPSGGGVQDPIGGAQSAYDAAAAQIARLVEARLEELDR